MNDRADFDRLFSQYRGLEFSFNGVNYYMHMNNPVKGCAIDLIKPNEYLQDYYKFDSLETMINTKMFDGKSFIELLEADSLKDEWYS